MENELAQIENKIDNTIKIYEGASTLKVTDEEQKQLLASFDEKMIEIRPDGLIYLPQTFWRKRLNESFGIGQWCLIPKGSTKDTDKNKCYLQGVMMVRGVFVAEAVGEAEYHESNPMQSWASVWESAKSDAITRCCKDLGIASELWQPQFSKAWVDKNAVQVWREKTGKKKNGEPGSFQWRKKTAPKFYDERGATNTTTDPPTQEVKASAKTDPKQKTEKKFLAKWEDGTKSATTAAWKNTVEALMRTDKPISMATIESVYSLNPDLKKELQEIANSVKQPV